MNRFAWNADDPPFSFRLGGRDSGEWLASAGRAQTTEKAPGGAITDLHYADPSGALEVVARVRRFDAFAATDWVLEIANRGTADTLLIEDILPLDLSLTMQPGEKLRIHHAKGSSCEIDDFLPLTKDLRAGRKLALAPVGGRSSNGVLPFMNLERSGGGMVLAVGWSGQWSAAFDRSKEALRVSAGMERTRLVLRPGERIRTPRILILDWEGGDPSAGTNLLRRLLIEHYLPRIDGELVTPPVAHCLQFYYYLTGDVNAELELKALPKVADLGATAYWIDACWYGQGRDWSHEVGNWTINRKRYPDGLKPIADAAHARGMKFVLWFEPARVRHDGDLAREHPDFVLRCPENPDNTLLDFGNPGARRHILDLFSKIIAESGVDVYREDFNFDPLPYWRHADVPDRVGMTEIRYIEGHYEFWDELRRRFPKLFIDNCASGGRRIDLETLSRSLPLWPSDFTDIGGLTCGLGLHVGDQCIKAGLARWVPLFGGGVWSFTPYSTRSSIIAGFTFGTHIDPKDFVGDAEASHVHPNDVMAKGSLVWSPEFPFDDARAAIAEWKTLRPFFLGDFHLLLPLTVSYHDWCAWQFHRSDLDAGFAVFLRRHRSPFATLDAELKGIDPDAQYDVSFAHDYEQPPRRRMSGRELAKQTIAIAEMPGSVLLRYSRVK
jgi:alpha-galactosidase